MAHQLNNSNSGQKPEEADLTHGGFQQTVSSAAFTSPNRPGLQFASQTGSSPQSTPTPSPISASAVAPFPAAPVLSAHHSPPTDGRSSARRGKSSKPRPGPLPGAANSAQSHNASSRPFDGLERPIGDYADVQVEVGKVNRVYPSELQSLASIGVIIIHNTRIT